jgi:hypothetical protein
MNPVLLYFLLLKATLTSFSGLASLPVIRADLVTSRHVLTDDQLNTAVVVSPTTPGPVGVYVVSVGYSVAGVPGAVAGWAAMCTLRFSSSPPCDLRPAEPRIEASAAPPTPWSLPAPGCSARRLCRWRRRRSPTGPRC